ncbi:hypothetical protein M569_08728 [Genlisea aurea]|uniref:Uncharacterized protein n=1 Tax=Genlisea aurea TaxID=192259 RepID=S8CGH3_9LAMI|nr:hypothetical protein M569_08728 [Genlisea aurea]
MAFLIARRTFAFRCMATNMHLLSRHYCNGRVHDKVPSVADTIHLSPLLSDINEGSSKCFQFELIDDEAWRLTSGLELAGACDEDKAVDLPEREDLDENYDDIEDMRIRGNLFYKIDKYSMEYEEFKFDFHRRKPDRKEKNQMGKPAQKKVETGEIVVKKKKTESKTPASGNSLSRLDGTGGDSAMEKNHKIPSFNQLTAPYHEPFCLDIHVTKGSVRASIIHRATSKVVAVAHSISKDMKFDLKSTKNKDACVAVGQVLAQRALEDDIHNAVFTPRKGEKLEGKLKIVLGSVINGGVDVKVRLKQTHLRRGRGNCSKKTLALNNI